MVEKLRIGSAESLFEGLDNQVEDVGVIALLERLDEKAAVHIR